MGMNDKINPQYRAPEIVTQRPYTGACDLWSLAVILFLLLGGKNPFQHSDGREQYDRLKSAMFNFKAPVWQKVSPEAKDFITRLLKVKPEDRMTPE